MVAGRRSTTTRERGGAVLEGLAEVAPEHALEEDAVLDVERLLQAELAVQLIDRRLRRALGQQHLGRIAGHDAQDDEDQQRDARRASGPTGRAAGADRPHRTGALGGVARHRDQAMPTSYSRT